ncbi:glycosyltransferase [Actinomycetospora sp. OC33-EN08]|uniref:Glycosyltransferase n=1 Tax=Actinomycetospora aurantiaca TaxID=3129233 RepID=A0ABU8MHF9_9PSEU
MTTDQDAADRADRADGALVVYAVSVAATATSLLRGQVGAMVAHGLRVAVVCSPGPGMAEFARDEGVKYHPLPMTRGLLGPGDVVSFVRAVRLLRRLRPAVVNAATPKAAFVIGLAAALARVPVRVYSLWGLRLEGERRGSWRYRLLWAAEWVTSRAATVVLCAGPELRDEAVALGIDAGRRCVVLGDGSTNGVDLRYFAAPPPVRRAELRRNQDLDPETVVFGFIGRSTADKGVEALVEAFGRMTTGRPRLLALIGPADATDPLAPATVRAIEDDPRIRHVGFVPDLRTWLHAFDVLVLPTRREGLPNVLLEAGAAGLPAITTTATGCRDAVDEGTTALVVPVDDAAALARAMDRLADDADLRGALGAAGRSLVEQRFDETAVWAAIAEFYGRELAGMPRRAATA